jgi:hypothetical protein
MPSEQPIFSISSIWRLDKFLGNMFDKPQERTGQGRNFRGGIVEKETHTVMTFGSYPFQVGQKIYIKDGPRHGDWEVIGVTDRKVTFRCPISRREFTWDRFCYFLEEQENSPWPHPD